MDGENQNLHGDEKLFFLQKERIRLNEIKKQKKQKKQEKQERIIKNKNIILNAQNNKNQINQKNGNNSFYGNNSAFGTDDISVSVQTNPLFPLDISTFSGNKLSEDFPLYISTQKFYNNNIKKN